MHKVKEYLILQCQLKSTGATIHNLNNVLLAYTTSCKILESCNDKEVEDLANKSEEILERFSVNGKLVMEAK